MADALAAHDLGEAYGATRTLDGVDLRVDEGELVRLLGLASGLLLGRFAAAGMCSRRDP